MEQLADDSQTRSIAAMIERISTRIDGKRTLAQLVDELYDEIEAKGLDAIARGKPGNLAMPRKMELFAAVNRHRGLTIKRDGPTPHPARERYRR
jgi:hypothetical protein